MKRYNVTFRPSALRDLNAIHTWVSEVSASFIVAESFVRRITKKCRKIGDMPHGGRMRDDLQPGLRTFPFERTAVIVYRVADHVEILRIYYGGQNFEALLSNVTASNSEDES